ncbi:short-chain dehydrogenase/reductase SDR [Streptomyces microflavus]|uniref:short-chain dehydrogenase/reductase SDR n=1 Tax=Streptomyces microflavus TaxID=1919 RepID=UPI0033D556A4
MEALHLDVAPFGIRTTTVEPGFFRTELLVEASTTWPELTVDDYVEKTAAQIAGWKTMNGQQAGDPAKLAAVLLTIAGQAEPPVRFVAGAEAIAAIEAHTKELLAQVDASRALGMDLAHDDGPA